MEVARGLRVEPVYSEHHTVVSGTALCRWYQNLRVIAGAEVDSARYLSTGVESPYAIIPYVTLLRSLRIRSSPS